jgi:hypothetical protein
MTPEKPEPGYLYLHATGELEERIGLHAGLHRGFPHPFNNQSSF